MTKKLFTLLLAVAASVGTMSAAITVRLDPSSCSSWSTVRLWAWTDEGNIFNSWPGQIVSQDGDGWYSYTFDASITSVSIIWNNGTYQTVDIEGVTSSTCYALNSTSGKAITVSVVNCSSGSSQGGTPVSGIYKIGDLYYNLDATNQTAEVFATSMTNGLIQVDDNSIAEWNTLPAQYVVQAICPADAAMTGLKSVKVYADAKYINILVEPNMDDLLDLSYVPFDIFLNTDNSDATGGYGDLFTDANTDILIEGALFSDNSPCSYAPAVFIWWGEVGGNGWLWTDPSVEHGDEDCWGTIVCEGQLPGCNSQYVNGKFEIQIDRSYIPATWNNTAFGIGVEILQSNWEWAGFLPCVSPTNDNPNGKAAKLQVTIDNTPFIIPDTEIIGNVVIPETVSDGGVTYTVTSIGNSAFYGCTGLTSIEIPNSVTSIGGRAFYGCSSLTSVTIGNSVTSIGASALYGCTGLTSVIWNAKNCADFTYSNSPFFNNDNDYSSFDLRNQITSFIFGSEVEHIPANLCSGMSNLTSIVIPNSVTSIGSSAFAGCGINKIYFPGTMEEWLSKSWSPGQISSSYSLYINDVAVTNVVIPNSVTSIGEGAFEGCSGLTSVTIPNSVTSIGYYAFYGCNNLKTVIIGSSVKVLEAAAFAYCSFIETITCYSQRPPTVNQDALYGLDYSTIVYVPADYLETYKMHDAWGLYDVRPLGAKSTETTDINVTPAETTAEVAWPAVSGAAMYELVIKDKDGNVICTLVFNSNGQLTQIAFNAPARNNAPQQTQAAGFSFTVTGLENGTSYDLTITSKDNNGTTLDTKTVSFTTTGEPQGIEDVLSDQVQSTKLIKNGQILILRGEKIYTLQGQEVK